MYAYAHTPLDEDTIKLTSFSSADKLFAFTGGFYGLKRLPNFFAKQMSTFFKTLIEQSFALVYIDDLHPPLQKTNIFALLFTKQLPLSILSFKISATRKN